MLPHFTRFLENVNVLFTQRPVGTPLVVLVDKLRQAQRASHAGRSTADDDDVGFHLRAIDSTDRSTKDHSFELARMPSPKGRLYAFCCSDLQDRAAGKQTRFGDSES